MRLKKILRAGTAAVAVVTFLALAGCGAPDVEADEPNALQPPAEAAPKVADPEETESATEVEWGDGTWPDGISFVLPENLALQDAVIDAEEQDYFGENRYRALTLGYPGSLAGQSDGLLSSGIDNSYLHEGLIFGAKFYVEHVMDSPILTQHYTEETRDEWLELVRDDLFDAQTAQYLRDNHDVVDEAPLAMSLVDAMDLHLSEREGDGLPEEGRLRVYGLLHEDEENRLANVRVSLTDSSVSADDLLRLTYDSSQTLLLWGIDFEGQERSSSMNLKWSGYRVILAPDGSSWKVWDLRPGIMSWDWAITPVSSGEESDDEG